MGQLRFKLNCTPLVIISLSKYIKRYMTDDNGQLTLSPAAFVFTEKEEYKIRHSALKRSFDIFFSLCVLVIGSPIFFLIALTVLVNSRGKVIFSHERIGRGGKPFRCYKFRTMHHNADSRLKELLAAHPELKEEWERTHKIKNDPRVTPFGRILRKTSLDELPQFWNVLIGDLSVVGPRPVVKAELQKYFGRKTPLLLSVRPGLTGLWQVSGRSNTSYEERIRLDEEYILKQTFITDLKLIAKTIPAMLSRRGAY